MTCTACKEIEVALGEGGEEIYVNRLIHTCGREWPRHLNVYEVSQDYGGPEEGGWYYDVGVPIESRRVMNMEEQEEEYQRLRLNYGFDDRSMWDNPRIRGKSSAAGGYDIEIRIEEDFAQPFPERKPHYE